MSVNFPIRGTMVNIKPPICAICTPGDEPRIILVQKGKGVRHWPNEGHIKRDTPVTKPQGDHGIPVKGVTSQDHSVVTGGNKTCNTCGKVVTRRKVCNKCRQAAYRERRK